MKLDHYFKLKMKPKRTKTEIFDKMTQDIETIISLEKTVKRFKVKIDPINFSFCLKSICNIFPFKKKKKYTANA